MCIWYILLSYIGRLSWLTNADDLSFAVPRSASRVKKSPRNPTCSCDSFSHETIFVNSKSIYKCIDTLESTLTCVLMPYKDLRARTFHVPPQAEPPCVELQSCDYYSHEPFFLNPKSIYKCINNLKSTQTCMLMPYEGLHEQTFWNRSCPTPSWASMCGTSVLWLFQSWNNFGKSKKHI